MLPLSLACAKDDLASKPTSITIEPQSLATALQAFSEQSGLQVGFASELAKGLVTHGVLDAKTPAQALDALLAGTGLEYRFVNEQTVIIRIVGAGNDNPHAASEVGERPLVLAQASTANWSGQAETRQQTGNSSESQNPSGRGSAGSGLEEIIVTAQKREERLQDVPMAITALDQAAIQKMGITNVASLVDNIPALTLNTSQYSSAAVSFFIRGVGQIDARNMSRDPGVGIYVDDVYIARAIGVTNDLGDLERVEVLRGPQGTLYGRNTVGGAVKFITAKPTGEFSLKESLDFGNFGYVRSLTSVNLPEWNNFSTKLTYTRSNFDGWVKNSGAGGDYGRKDQEGARAAVRWRPAGAVTVDYAFDYGQQDGAPNYFQRSYNTPDLPGFPNSGIPQTVHVFIPTPSAATEALLFQPSRQDRTWRPVDTDIRDDFNSRGHALTASWEISEAATIKSVTSYRALDVEITQDDAEAFDFAEIVDWSMQQHQFSQELLLSGSLQNARWKYNLGAYYFSESGEHLRAATAFSGYGVIPASMALLSPYRRGAVESSSNGVYGNITYTPNILQERLTIDLGGRYSADDRRTTPFVVVSQPLPALSRNTYSSFDPSAVVDYRWTESLHTYAKYATGYRAGGFNMFNTSLPLAAFEPEKLTSYEIGMKSMWWEDRLRFNVDAFVQNYTNLQLDYYLSPVLQQTASSGRARYEGVEGDMELRPMQQLRLLASFAYLSPKHLNPSAFILLPYNPPVLNGANVVTPLPNAPKWKYDLSAEYTFLPTAYGELSVFASYSFNGSQYLTAVTGSDRARPAYSLINGRISLSSIAFAGGEISVALWANNLADKKYWTYNISGGAIYGQPRSYGANLTYSY